jgi:hypothetical protein
MSIGLDSRVVEGITGKSLSISLDEETIVVLDDFPE